MRCKRRRGCAVASEVIYWAYKFVGENDMQVIVFDLGGTLMEYKGMPLSWVDYYEPAFVLLNRKLNYPVTDGAIRTSVEMLKSFNPRVNYREVEYKAEDIFSKVLSGWGISGDISFCVDEFWSGLKLKAEIYPDAVDTIRFLRGKGYVVAALTDLPNGMPDRVFTKDIKSLIEHFDCYMSSETVGYRKPNPAGLVKVARKYSCEVEDVIFIGDEEKDRKTAENVGCRFIKISRNKTENYDIADLSELTKMLKL